MPNSANADGLSGRGITRPCAVAGARPEKDRAARLSREPSREPEQVDGGAWGKARLAGQRSRRVQEDQTAWQVTVDLPTSVPILTAELVALEAHLGAAIEVILSGDG